MKMKMANTVKGTLSVLLGCLLIVGESYAGDFSGNITVSEVEGTGSFYVGNVPEGTVLIWINGNHPTPACAQTTSNRYAIPPTNKTAIAYALIAQLTNRPIYIAGSGICDVFGDTEDIKAIHF